MMSVSLKILSRYQLSGGDNLYLLGFNVEKRYFTARPEYLSSITTNVELDLFYIKKIRLSIVREYSRDDYNKIRGLE